MPGGSNLYRGQARTAWFRDKQVGLFKYAIPVFLKMQYIKITHYYISAQYSKNNQIFEF